MKLVQQKLSREGSGSLQLVAEESEDLWHVYNIIAPGDRVTTTTVRKVQKDTAGGGTDSQRVKLKLTIDVTGTEYDALAPLLRLSGRNVTESEHIKLGAHHTLEVELHRPFVVTKELWDALVLDRIKSACDPAAGADVAAVVMSEGLANVCLIGNSTTIVRARIEASIPKKRGPAVAGVEKALNRFFEHVLQAVLKYVDFSVVKCLVIASPGFVKDQFWEYAKLEAQRRDIRSLIENKERVVLCHSSTGYKHSLKEVLADPAVMARMKDTKAAREVRALQAFFDMMSVDENRALYGPGHVFAAHERLAVQDLLLADGLFRSADTAERLRYVDLVEGVKSAGGNVHIFSAMHPSGEQLQQLSGIAAVLRFPLPDVADMEL